MTEIREDGVTNARATPAKIAAAIIAIKKQVKQLGSDEKNDHGGLNYYEVELNHVAVCNEGMHPGTQVVSKAMTDYLEAADVVKTFDGRLREIEAVIMRGETERSDKAQQELLAAFSRL